MADGSVNPASNEAASQQITAAVMIDQDWILDLPIPGPKDIGGADAYVRISERLSQMASATLRVALVRGENDSDMPMTFSDAVQSAAILLQLSNAVTAQARTMLVEKAHG